MLDLNPNLSADFWDFDDSIGALALNLPTWLNLNAIKARKKCLTGMKRWRRNAVNQTKPAEADDVPCDPVWGLGAIRPRNKLLDTTEGLFDEDRRASIDLALIWSYVFLAESKLSRLTNFLLDLPRMLYRLRFGFL